MAISPNKQITVYNYNDFYVSIQTDIRTYMLEPCRDKIPTMTTLLFSEITYVNSISSVFRTGMLVIDKKDRKAVFEELNISEKGILYNNEIEDIILNPTMEKLQKIIEITDDSVFERIRNRLIHLKNVGKYDISHRVIKIIEVRQAELKLGNYKSQITLRQEMNYGNSSDSNVVELQEQNKLMTEQMKQMQEQMALLTQQLLTKNENKKVKNIEKTTNKPSVKK